MEQETPRDPTAEQVLDQYLVVSSQAGSAEALDGLARRWTPRLQRYAARMLGGTGEHADAARDVVQETWVGAIRGLRSLRDPALFPAWIYGIATRRCADAIRGTVRRRQLGVRAALDGTEEPRSRPDTDETRLDLTAGIRGLTPEHRVVVHLYYGEELGIAEIALALAIPAGTVKSRLHHARAALKRYLAPAAAPGNLERPAAAPRKDTP